MSLTSRVANPLTSGSTASQQQRSDLGFADNGLPGGKETLPDVKFGVEDFKPETMGAEPYEKEGRPPYLHVIRAVSDH